MIEKYTPKDASGSYEGKCITLPWDRKVKFGYNKEKQVFGIMCERPGIGKEPKVVENKIALSHEAAISLYALMAGSEELNNIIINTIGKGDNNGIEGTDCQMD